MGNLLQVVVRSFAGRSQQLLGVAHARAKEGINYTQAYNKQSYDTRCS